MRRLIGATEVWSRRWLDCGGGKVERVEQLVQALPIVWFPRNREKMKKKKEKKDWPQLTQIAAHDGNCWLIYFFLAISNLDIYLICGHCDLALGSCFWVILLSVWLSVFPREEKTFTLGFNKNQTQIHFLSL
ncbi:hypothetical protein ACJW30_04G093700 [Castanea mollissima]